MSVIVEILSKDRTGKGFGSASRQVKGLERDVQKASRAFKMLSIAAAGIGIKAVNSFAKFDNKVREITTLLGDTAPGDIKKLGNEIKKTATIYGQSLNTMAKARYDIISAGFKSAAESALLMEQAAKTATAGITDVATAADILTTVMNAYGLEASEAADVSDVLFTIVRQGKTTFSEIASTFGRVSAIAPQVGASLTDVASIMGTLTAAGQSTEEVSTALTATMTAFLTPSEAMEDRLKKLDHSTGAAMIRSLGFIDAIKKLTENMDEAEKAALFPNQRALRLVFPAVGEQAEKLAENIKDMGERAGRTGDAFGKMSEGIQFRINQIKTQISARMTDIGNSIILAAGKFLDLDDTIKNIAVSILGVAASIKFLGTRLTVIGTIAYAVFNIWSENIGGFRTFTESTAKDLSLLFQGLWEDIKVITKDIGTLFMGVAKSIGNILTFSYEDSVKASKDMYKNLAKNHEEYTNNITRLSKEYQENQTKFNKDWANEQKGTLKNLFGDINWGTFSLKANIDTGAGAGAAAKEQFDVQESIAAASYETQRELWADHLMQMDEILQEVGIDWNAYYEEKLELANQFTNAAANLFSNLSQLQKNNIQNELQNDLKAHQKKYENRRKLLIKQNTVDGKLTQRGHTLLENLEQGHQATISNLKEKARQEEIRAAKMMKPVQMAQAISNTALAVIKALASTTPPWNFALAALVGAAGAAQTAVIASQPYAKGTAYAFNPSGTDTVPAMLSPGEAVIPAPVVRQNITQVQELVAGKGSGGGQTIVNISPVYNISAVDGDSVRRFVQSEENKQALIDLINDRELNLQVDGINVEAEA